MDSEGITGAALHLEYLQWKKELDHWEEELYSLEHRLEELRKRWKNQNLLAQLEHYQGEFILQKEDLNGLRQDIGKHKAMVSEQQVQDDKPIHTHLHESHLEIKSVIALKLPEYMKLKKDFFYFLSKHM
ncbi:hypothetical protein SAMN04487911_12133 [Arenibacter nanhaiticus]|uniref:Uncharacterized protein n=1 Tax=Arenibacter nanhaiticus TaxID=558155 RepID=A0A1M6JB66_9FLAO|nr:hypothetical protein [Arenibacter nanhaiticus]SHJ43911.1 hypothetical protein SAMN04487911_12133 [Arenibacter nanhaiticus]